MVPGRFETYHLDKNIVQIMKIVPYEGALYGDDEVHFDEVTIKYYQDADCTEEKDGIQELEITSRNNGIARFINIKTDGWLIDDPQQLVNIVNDFCDRAGIKLDD